MQRRLFLRQTAAIATTAALAAAANLRAATAAGRKLRVAVVALGRGLAHVQALLTLPDVEIAYLAEVDPKRLATGMKLVAEKQTAPCKGLRDFRECLGDATLDAVFIATPNFWHTPAALLALAAGKHVYVEKPGSGTGDEAERLVAAAEKSGRVVQMGNQRRTWMRDAIATLHGGIIGPVRNARAFYYNARKATGLGAQKAPAELDLDLWQGPLTDEPGRDLRAFVHYDWHWLWHWGNGELGNNGIHYLDILRWGIKGGLPQRVSYFGGRYFHQDVQQTPDTATALFDYGHASIEWTHSSSHPRNAEKPLAECIFYGDGGTFAIQRNKWTAYDPNGVETATGKSPGGDDAAHIGNFLDGIRGTAALNSPITEGQKSTLLCHLGNLAYRTNSVIQLDPATGKIKDNAAALALWSRPYRPGWLPGGGK